MPEDVGSMVVESFRRVRGPAQWRNASRELLSGLGSNFDCKYRQPVQEAHCWRTNGLMDLKSQQVSFQAYY